MMAHKQLVFSSSPDKEIGVWTTLKHPNIVPLFGMVDSLKEKLVMPLCNGMALRRRLTDLPDECSERKFQLRVLVSCLVSRFVCFLELNVRLLERCCCWCRLSARSQCGAP